MTKTKQTSGEREMEDFLYTDQHSFTENELTSTAYEREETEYKESPGTFLFVLFLKFVFVIALLGAVVLIFTDNKYFLAIYEWMFTE